MDRKQGESGYNWQFTGEDGSSYRDKYTQGFDPQYIQHTKEKQEKEEQEQTERAAKKKPASGRRRRLAEQQRVASSSDVREIDEPEEEFIPEESSYPHNSRSRRNKAYWRQVHILRFCIYAAAAALALLIVLLIVNKHRVAIELAGDNPLYVDHDDLFTDPGATAFYQGTIFHIRDREVAVTSTNDVDTSTYGTYQIRYRASYKGQEAEEIRTVIIRDTSAPTIELNAAKNVVLRGQAWQDDFKAEDDRDGDITDKVEVIGEVDTGTNGTYELTYRVSDASGNIATAKREVIVSNIQINNPGLAEQGDPQVVYLTFDDGPGPYTEELLDLFDRYNVKATFFTTHQNPEVEDLIRREVEAGHTVGNHTASHDYDYIYSNAENFWKDFDEMDAILEEQTGSKSKFMRFPGGSSNGIAIENGLSKQLLEEVQKRGLTYVDWTLICGDSSYEITEEMVYETIKLALDTEDKPDILMFLCHDLVEETVDAMKEIIPWCLEQGYVFLPIDEDTPIVHHVLPE